MTLAIFVQPIWLQGYPVAAAQSTALVVVAQLVLAELIDPEMAVLAEVVVEDAMADRVDLGAAVG